MEYSTGPYLTRGDGGPPPPVFTGYDCKSKIVYLKLPSCTSWPSPPPKIWDLPTALLNGENDSNIKLLINVGVILIFYGLIKAKSDFIEFDGIYFHMNFPNFFNQNIRENIWVSVWWYLSNEHPGSYFSTWQEELSWYITNFSKKMTQISSK